MELSLARFKYWAMVLAAGLPMTFTFGSYSLRADVLEERSWTGISQQIPSPFQLNPAALSSQATVISIMQLKQTEEASYIFNPNNNPAKGEHKTEVKDLAIGGQYPLGGAAAGLTVDQYNRSVKAKHENRNGTQEESLGVREYKMNFSIDLTGEFRTAFSFRYQNLESDLLGSHFLNNQDRTRYKGTRSGYAIGGFYQLKGMGIGLYTVRPLRGKATIEGEQKIISDPGFDGLEFGLDASDRLKFKVSALRWVHKRDDRDDDSTSPIDQRGIMLRGLEVDQYFRKTQVVSLGVEYLLTPLVAAKVSVANQHGVFLFDAKALPGQRENLETKMDYNDFKFGLGLRNKEFTAEIMYFLYEREAGSISVQRGDIGLGQLGSYEASRSGILISLGAAL